LSMWLENTLQVIDTLNKPLILVGSSMGGWLMLLAALQRQALVKGLLGIAAAPDFTHDLMIPKFKDAQHKELGQNGKIMVPPAPNAPAEHEPYPITQNLLNDAKQHLLLHGSVDITCPVRLLHGMQDQDVPHQTSVKLARQLASDDVEVQLVKNAGHGFSSPAQLTILQNTLLSLLA